MAAPTNQTALTAIDIPTLTANISQDVRDAGTTYTVWYQYTAKSSDFVISVFPFGDLSVYKPSIQVFLGPAAVPVAYSGLTTPQNKPLQFFVTPGVTYYFKFATNSASASPAILLIHVESSPQSNVLAGDIFVADDIGPAPNVVLSATTDYLVKRLFKFSALKEQGDNLENGNMLAVFGDTTLVVFDRSFNYMISFTEVNTTFTIVRANRSANKFYFTSGAGAPVIKTLDTANVIATKATLVSFTSPIGALASNNNETVLYFVTSSVTTGLAIKRWNLLTDLAMTDLVAGLTNYRILDILGLADGSIIVLYYKISGGVDTKAIQYDAAGTTVRTFNFGSTNSGDVPRLAYGLDYPDSFWVWIHQTSAGTCQFIHVRISDGTVLATIQHVSFTSLGTFGGTASATPLGYFGASSSCPFLILTQNGPMLPAVSSGLYKITSGKITDTLYGSDGLPLASKIPDPFATCYLIGEDE